MNLIETVKILCGLSGVSGREDEVRDYILERVMPFADEIATDAMGNLMALKKGADSSGTRLMLCAHMDEVGLIIKRADDDGVLRFGFVGGVDRRCAIGRRVYIGKDKIPGVIGLKPARLADKGERNAVPKTEDLYIDIGVSSKTEALERIRPGDCASFGSDILELGDELVMAKALDDRIGCAVMLNLLEEDGAPPHDVWFAFTVQEEVGLRGAAAAAYRIKPDVAIALETAACADLPTAPARSRVCRVGGGPVIPFMDRCAVYDRGLYETLTGLAEANGINWQTKEAIAGGTDGAAVQRSGAGVRAAALSVAVRNIHTPASVASLSDMEDVMKLARLFISEIE